MEEMVGKRVVSKTLQRHGQEKAVMSRNLVVQVQDLKQAGKLEVKALSCEGKVVLWVEQEVFRMMVG